MDINNKMSFFCVYCKTRKKFDKFIKVNKIKNKYIIDLKKILGENDFNVLIFYNEFRKSQEVMDDVFSNLSKFSNSQIIRDY